MRTDLRDCSMAAVQYLLPTIVLSRLAFYITRIRAPVVKNFLIRLFCRYYAVDLSEAVLSRPEEFLNFNAFFTRALRPELRPQPQVQALLTSPVDGRIDRCGVIDGNRIIQAKGRTYSTVELLGGDSGLSAKFFSGDFCTIYLAPNNYHRIHMPVNGSLIEWAYIPGRLLSVNPKVTSCVPNLFARNERLVAVFTTPYGALAIVMVGALFVGSIKTVWAGISSPPHPRHGGILRHRLNVPIGYERGTEIGRFNMGSTVILLTSAGMLEWPSESMPPGMSLQVGETLASCIKATGNVG